MSFERALIHIFKTEGGFVNRLEDQGGATNFGITLATLADYRKTPVTEDDVRNLTATEAGRIYRHDFWDANHLFLVDSPRVQYLLFDQIVNRGGHSAVILLQKVLNSYFKAGLKYDGVLGPATALAINTADELELCLNYIREIQKAYFKQAFRDPSQMVFLEGWLNRSLALFDFIARG